MKRGCASPKWKAQLCFLVKPVVVLPKNEKTQLYFLVKPIVVLAKNEKHNYASAWSTTYASLKKEKSTTYTSPPKKWKSHCALGLRFFPSVFLFIFIALFSFFFFYGFLFCLSDFLWKNVYRNLITRIKFLNIPTREIQQWKRFGI